jgi:hypothetical protein
MKIDPPNKPKNPKQRLVKLPVDQLFPTRGAVILSDEHFPDPPTPYSSKKASLPFPFRWISLDLQAWRVLEITDTLSNPSRCFTGALCTAGGDENRSTVCPPAAFCTSNARSSQCSPTASTDWHSSARHVCSGPGPPCLYSNFDFYLVPGELRKLLRSLLHSRAADRWIIDLV